MAKKAFLVSFAPMTRVVVDVDDETLEDEMDFAKVIRAARAKILESPGDYLSGDNCDEAKLDEEVPYDPETDDN